MTTKIGQLNLHKAIAPSALTARKFSKDNFGLMLLQEPWVSKGKICGLQTREGDLVYNRRQKRPRACILINKKVVYTTLPEHLSMDLVAVEVKSGTKPETSVVIASAYFPGEKEDEAPPQKGEGPGRVLQEKE